MNPSAPNDIAVRDYVRGALFGIAAVGIWSGWMLAARFSIKGNLSPWDILAIRFLFAGPLLLPILVRKGLALERLGWSGLAALLIGGGAPMVLVGNAGLLFAPAAHGSALFTGTIPIMVAVVAAFLIRERFTIVKRIGLVLVSAGVLGIVWGAGGTFGSRQNLGHLMFLSASVLWAFYTVAMRKARLDGLHAAAIAGVGAFLTFEPAYFAVNGLWALSDASWRDLALQAIVQGVLTSIVSYLLYGRAIAILGASSGAAFSALAPAMTAIFGIPLLGEWPTPLDWIAVALISVGVYFGSGGPLPNRLRTTLAR